MLQLELDKLANSGILEQKNQIGKLVNNVKLGIKSGNK
jgi:hypothetical protein